MAVHIVFGGLDKQRFWSISVSLRLLSLFWWELHISNRYKGKAHRLFPRYKWPRPGRSCPWKSRYPLRRRLGRPQGRDGRVCYFSKLRTSKEPQSL